MNKIHPLLDGLRVDSLEMCNNGSLFVELYDQIRTNWVLNRVAGRWPSQANWRLRVAREFSEHPTRYLEKQLQKKIAILFEHEDWGNDVPTASGLVNDRGRQMNIDLAHRISGGFEFVELKLKSNTPYEAAFQVFRYGAVYMLYRLEPELAERFSDNEMLNSKRIVLEVLAPIRFYGSDGANLHLLEEGLNRQLAELADSRKSGVSLSFRFMAFSANFEFKPDMDSDLIRDAVQTRMSPFA